MKKLLIVLLLPFLFLENHLFAQGEIDEQQKVFFRNEKSFSVSLATDGFLVGYRDGRRIDYLNKTLYEVDFGILKHPKEYKISSAWTNASFKFGKVNSVCYIRGGIGRQHEVFKKADLGGIAVRYFYTGGVTLSLYKPIYYKPAEIVPIDTTFYLFVKDGVKFTEDINSYDEIYCKDKFTRGLSETKLLPGVYGKIGLNFEYSVEDKAIHALEIGGQINAFPKKIPIMIGKNNKAIYPSLFISYRIGIIVDPLSREKSDIFKIFRKRRVTQEQ